MSKPLTFGTRNTHISFRVPQSVQKVKTAKFHKPKGIMETKKVIYLKLSSILLSLFLRSHRYIFYSYYLNNASKDAVSVVLSSGVLFSLFEEDVFKDAISINSISYLVSIEASLIFNPAFPMAFDF